MNGSKPTEGIVYLTPEQMEDLRRRYRAKSNQEAVLALLIAAAGFFVLKELAEKDKPKRRRSAR